MDVIQFTEKQNEAVEAVASGDFDFVLYGGAIRGGKTYWGLLTLLILCELYPNSRWAVIRESDKRIRQTTIPSFNKIQKRGHLRQTPFEYKHHNSSVIVFMGENYDKDKDLDAFKGLEVNGFLFEEINECQKQTFYKAFERAGSWIIPNTDIQPKPIVMATCNPTYTWVKELVYTPYKEGTLNSKWCYIPAKITDNPHLPEAYKESLKNLPRYEYEVFVEGNWDIQLKTGGEFLKGFELDKHVKRVAYNPNQTLHISIDSNVFPYIAVSIWQMEKINEKWIVKLVHELPCVDPDNTASKAGLRLANYLISIGYFQTVFMYGDRSTKNRNNIDDDKRSFYEIFIESLKNKGFKIQDNFLSHAPPVASIADFVNAIFDQTLKFAEIIINEDCKTIINDFLETKQDKDGSMLKKRITDPKTKISYEPNGHFVDTFKDFIVQAFFNEFNNYKRGGEESIRSFVPRKTKSLY